MNLTGITTTTPGKGTKSTIIMVIIIITVSKSIQRLREVCAAQGRIRADQDRPPLFLSSKDSVGRPVVVVAYACYTKRKERNSVQMCNENELLPVLLCWTDGRSSSPLKPTAA